MSSGGAGLGAPLPVGSSGPSPAGTPPLNTTPASVPSPGPGPQLGDPPMPSSTQDATLPVGPGAAQADAGPGAAHVHLPVVRSTSPDVPHLPSRRASHASSAASLGSVRSVGSMGSAVSGHPPPIRGGAGASAWPGPLAASSSHGGPTSGVLPPSSPGLAPAQASTRPASAPVDVGVGSSGPTGPPTGHPQAAAGGDGEHAVGRASSLRQPPPASAPVLSPLPDQDDLVDLESEV